MEAYSDDLRERVVRACDEGQLTQQEIADQFGVSTSWIRRILQRRRELGTISALPGGRGPQPKLSAVQQKRLKKLVEEYPDATLAELKKRSRLRCSVSTIYRTVKSLGFSFKKSRYVQVSKIGVM